MLYTFSQAHYDNQTLQSLLAQIRPQDAVLLWQDGVLQAVRYAEFFANCPQLFVLEQDVLARGIDAQIPAHFQRLTLDDFVRVSEQYFPQMAF